MTSLDPGRTADAAALGRRGAVLLFAVAFGLRVAAMLALDTPAQAADGDTWLWGAEVACIARSLVEQGAYADPWCQGTGPTAWLTPPYPVLVAVLMALFGGVTPATATALLVLQSALSAATALLLVELGRRLGWARAGRLAGWLWALYPLAIWNASKTVWDTTCVAFGVTAFLVVLLGAPATSRGALRSGLAFGALLFLNPAPTAFLPAILLHYARRGGSVAKGLGLTLTLSCAALLVCLPWIVRNRLVLGTFALRPNLGVELRIGNHDEASGRPVPFKYHPSGVAQELALYRELGEVDYAAENSRRAWRWVRANPGAFLALSARRVQFFWLGESPTSDTRREGDVEPGGDWNSWLKFAAFLGTAVLALGGLALARGPAGSRLFLATALALFGAPYYLTHVSERYRFPIDPLLVLLDACLLVELGRRLRARPPPR